MIISYIPITAISVESGESVVDGSTAGAPIAVPEEGLAISGGTLYGIDKTWFANVNPDKGKIYLAISIPSGVTEINNDGLKDSYTSDKKLHDAVTYMDGLGSFSVAALSGGNKGHISLWERAGVFRVGGLLAGAEVLSLCFICVCVCVCVT